MPNGLIARIIYTMRLVLMVGKAAWRNSDSSLTYAATIDRYGVPQVVIVVGQGREAWRVSTFAVEALRRIG